MDFIFSDEPMLVAIVFPFHEAEIAALESFQSHSDREIIVEFGDITACMQSKV